jgi:hypothetical protein
MIRSASHYCEEMIAMRSSSIGLLVGFLLTGILVGCGGQHPTAPLAAPSPVQGKITLANGSALRGGIVYFTPKEVETSSGQFRYEGAGLINNKGEYKAGLPGKNDGLPPGEYKVTVKPRDYQEISGSNSRQIPAKYRDQGNTPLAVTIEEKENTFNFVLK